MTLNSVVVAPMPSAIVRIATGRTSHVRDQPTTVEAIAGYISQSMTAVRSGQSEPIRLRVTAMTPSAFDVLRGRPLRGRVFTDDEVPPSGMAGVDAPRPIDFTCAPGGTPGRDDAIGGVIRLDDVPHTIVGVMPTSFVFPDTDTRVVSDARRCFSRTTDAALGGLCSRSLNHRSRPWRRRRIASPFGLATTS